MSVRLGWRREQCGEDAFHGTPFEARGMRCCTQSRGLLEGLETNGFKVLGGALEGAVAQGAGLTVSVMVCVKLES